MIRGRSDGQYIYLIFAKYTRELIIVLKTKSVIQKQRTSLELVKDINTATNNSRDTITIRYLLNKDIFVAFQRIPEKQKQKACLEILQVFRINTRFYIKEYIVLVYNIQVRSINQIDQVEVIINIYIQNPQLKNIVYIIKVS